MKGRHTNGHGVFTWPDGRRYEGRRTHRTDSVDLPHQALHGPQPLFVHAVFSGGVSAHTTHAHAHTEFLQRGNCYITLFYMYLK